MSKDELDRVIEGLDARFDALARRADEEAAADLAVSFVQGRTLIDALWRGGGAVLLLPDGLNVPVARVGLDFVASGPPANVVVPLRAAVFLQRGQGTAPASTRLSLIELLRGWARKRAQIEVTVGDSTYAGVLLACGEEHLDIRSGAGRLLVATGALTRARLVSEGGSGDAT